MDIQVLLDSLASDGFCVVPSLLPETTCSGWMSVMTERDAGEPDSTNYHAAHRLFFIGDRADEVSMASQLLTNTALLRIVRSALGANCFLSSFCCNANAAHSPAQPLHVDQSPFVPALHSARYASAGPPLQLIANLYLSDTSERNGSLAIVPGTHVRTGFTPDEETLAVRHCLRAATDDDDDDDDRVCADVEFRCNGDSGTVIVRDKRTWHRGMPNDSERTRFMISATFAAPVLGGAGTRKLFLCAELIEALQDAGVPTFNLKSV